MASSLTSFFAVFSLCGQVETVSLLASRGGERSGANSNHSFIYRGVLGGGGEGGGRRGQYRIQNTEYRLQNTEHNCSKTHVHIITNVYLFFYMALRLNDFDGINPLLGA
jgi:hypothetical protein